MNELNKFNTGGRHEENPLTGIPIGNNNNVEEGETKYKDFIYSDRIKVNKDLLSQFNLPQYLKDKTYAQASEVINNKFKDRNDKASNETKDTLLNRLAEAHEYTKLQESLKANSTEVPDMMNGEVPAGFEDFVPNQMFLGGFNGAGDSANTNNSMNTMQGITRGLNMLSSGLNSRQTQSPYLSQTDQKLNQNETMVGSTKDSVASMFGPFGQLFRGIEKAGNSIGDSIGGDTGNYISAAFSPDEAIMRNNADPDVKTEDKILGTILPFHAAKMSKKAQEKREEKARANTALALNSEYNQYAYGGPTRPRVNSITDTDAYKNLVFNQNLVDQYNLEQATAPTGTPIEPLNYADTTTNNGSNFSLKPAGDWLKNNYGDIMRFAPVATNALQLANLKKAPYQRSNRLGNRYNPQYVDEQVLQNTINTDFNNTINNLTNASNGSQGALRSNILAAGLNRSRALTDAYLNTSNINRQQNQVAQQFNLGVDETNQRIDMMDRDINDRNSAAYENAKSKLIAQLGNDIGNIGKEEVYKRIAKTAFGYDWLGNYVKQNPNATKEETLAAYSQAIDTPKTTMNSYGGFLKSYKK